MRNYNQKQLLQKHQQDERIRRAEEQLPRLREIRREIAGLGLLKARLLLGAQKGTTLTWQKKYRLFLWKSRNSPGKWISCRLSGFAL